MKQDEEYLKIIKAETRLWYDKIGKVRCPSLSNDVYFNAQEFHHTSYDGGGRARNAKEIIYKLILLPLACPVIKYAKVVDEYRKEKQSENRKKKGSILTRLKKPGAKSVNL